MMGGEAQPRRCCDGRHDQGGEVQGIVTETDIVRNGDRQDVLIVGAGIGGLTLGLLLGERGYHVTVVERRQWVEPVYKPELLQPAGLQVLHALGVLEPLDRCGVPRCRIFQFLSAGRRPLCRVDYGMLRHPFPYALIALPHVTQSVLLERLTECPTVRVRWGCALSELVRPAGPGLQAIIEERGRLIGLSASVVVGADGRSSRVRETTGLAAQRIDYPDAFVSCLVRRPASFGEAVQYYLGRRRILGMFPVSPQRLCLLFMVPAEGFDSLKARGLSALKAGMATMADGVAELLAEVTGWERIAYLSCQAVRATSWVGDRVALLGDAAHACHPHVAQGSTQAILDAVALADALSRCLDGGDCSAEALSAYEKSRRPHVETLQQIADDYAWLWNTGNPVLAWLRDRAFRKIGQRPVLLAKVVETEAGLRAAPLSIPERLQAVGVLP